MAQQRLPSTDTPGSGMTRVVASLLLIMGLTDLVLWQVAPALVVAVSPHHFPITPLAGLAFCFTAVALGLATIPTPGCRRAVTGLGALILLIGLGTLAEYAFGLDLGLDRVPFAQPLSLPSLPFPGRPAPNSAILFVLLGLALTYLDATPVGRFWPAEALAALASVGPYLALSGYAYHLDALVQVRPYIGMALPTAVMGLLAVAGLFAARPHRGYMAQLASPGAGGIARRRFWPAAVAVPPLLGALTLGGADAGYFSTGMGVAGLIMALALLAQVAIESCAIVLDKLDDQRLRVIAEVEDLYDHAPCGYHSLDRHGYFVRVNATELRWLGYERGELIGRKRFRDLLEPASRASFQQHFPRFLAEGHVEDLEFDLRRRDGSRLSVLLSATALYDAQGRYMVSRSTLHDVTRRRKAELALRRSEEGLALAQRITRLGSWELDLTTDKLSWSDQTFRLFGLEPRAVEPTRELALAHIHPADRARVEAIVGESIRLRCPYLMDFRIVQAEGTLLNVHAEGQVLSDEGGQPARVVGTVQDVTELRRVQTELARQADELERAHELGRLKDRFLSGVSHELKTPLAEVLGFAELLDDKYPGDPLAGGLIAGGRRLEARLTHLIDYSALLSGSMPMFKIEVAPLEVVEQAVAISQEAFDRKGVPLRVHVAAALPTLQADPRRLSQALSELLDNALQFTPAGAAAGIHVSAHAGEVHFAVWDSGPGVSPAAMARLWETFDHAGQPDGERPSSLGLGLAIARAIVEQHGGRIAVSARRPGGACFRLVVPIAAPVVATAPVATPE